MSGPGRDGDDPTGGQPSVVFNTGPVYGPNHNIGRDAYFGDVHVRDVLIGGRPVPADQVPGRLREGLRHTTLGRRDARRAQDWVDEIEVALGAEEPDRPRAARALAQLTRVLSAAGTLAAAGAALIDPMTGLALWLGRLGASVLGELTKP